MMSCDSTRIGDRVHTVKECGGASSYYHYELFDEAANNKASWMVATMIEDGSLVIIPKGTSGTIIHAKSGACQIDFGGEYGERWVKSSLIEK